MGVLEAREDAGKVEYPVVGEKIEYGKDEIPYNIREEITMDESSVFSANNNTTTGLATVIPGVNAPKLIASTSVTGIPESDPEGSYYGTYVASGATPYVTVAGKSTSAYLPYTMAEDSNTLPFTWEIKDGGVVFPRAGGYSVTIRYFTMGQEEYLRYDKVSVGGTVVDTTSGIYSSTDHTVTFNANKGDILKCETAIYNDFNEGYTKNARVRFTITPK